MKESEQAILLHRIPFSESSLILTLFTKNHGLQKFLFQGAKKKKNPIIPLSLVEITYYKRPDSELGKISSFSLYENAEQIMIDPVRSSIAFFLAETIRQCVKDYQKDLNLYHFLENQTKALNTSRNLALFPLHFLLAFAQHLGIAPAFENEIMSYFNINDGEFSNIPSKSPDQKEGPEVLYIQYLSNNLEIPINIASYSKKAFDLILVYYQHHIPHFNMKKPLEILRAILYD